MLEPYQRQIVAWEGTRDGDLVCDADVRARVRNDVWLERVKLGLDEHPDWTPVIQYEAAERGWVCDECGIYHPARCDECGETIE